MEFKLVFNLLTLIKRKKNGIKFSKILKIATNNILKIKVFQTHSKSFESKFVFTRNEFCARKAFV